MLAVALLLTAACSDGSEGTEAERPEGPTTTVAADAIATVNGVAITPEDFARYSAVFRDRESGALDVPAGHIVEALVAQEIVLQYAADHELSDPADDGHGHEELPDVTTPTGQRITEANPFLTEEQSAENIRRFVVFSRVRTEVVADALPPASSPRTEARAAEEDAVWQEWLAVRRDAEGAVVVIADEDTLAALAAPPVDVGRRATG